MTSTTQHKTRIGATYSIPLDTLGETLAMEEKSRLTMVPKNSFGSQPNPVVAWFVEDGHLHVPRFYGIERYGKPMFDCRSDGVGILGCEFKGSLTDVQTRAVNAVVQKHFCLNGDHGAIICIPCGMGKTVLAVYLITQILKRKACVLVHKALIRDQWNQAFQKFCPGIRVGFVQGKMWQVDEYDVVIAMILTVAKRDFPIESLDCIGTVCCDECHHMAAPVMSKAMRKFRARNIFGLTATKDRPDGLTPLLHMTLGFEAFRAERLGGESVRVSMAVLPNLIPDIKSRDGKPLTSIMTTKLALNPERNRFIAKRVSAMRKTGRIIMVLSDRIEQLKALKRMIFEEGIPEEEIGIFYGKTPDEERCVELAKEVALCSYGMANEGLDKKEADTCVMASPKGGSFSASDEFNDPVILRNLLLCWTLSMEIAVFKPSAGVVRECTQRRNTRFRLWKFRMTLTIQCGSCDSFLFARHILHLYKPVLGHPEAEKTHLCV